MFFLLLMPQDCSASIVILAAGQSRRFLSKKSKVMHPLSGAPLLQHSLDAAAACDPLEIVVVASPPLAQDPAFVKLIKAYPHARVAIQHKPRGTADALRCAFEEAPPLGESVMVLLGDVPLLTASTLKSCQDHAHTHQADICVMTLTPEDPTGYGRCIVDDQERLVRIVEDKDATPDERTVSLCNSGIWWMTSDVLSRVKKLAPSPTTGELYLTDVVQHASVEGKICTFFAGPHDELLGINTRADLMNAEHLSQQRLRHKALAQGVTLYDMATTFFSYDTCVAADVTIEPFVFIGPGVTLDEGVTVHAHTVISHAHIQKNASVGPFASISQQTVLEESAVLGSFVEGKRLHMKKGAKAKHLSYLGDAVVGEHVNVGAGCVTCNYDGTHKHTTTIGSHTFVGANTSLIAPLVIGEHSVVGAGSVITDDVPTKNLALGRGRQVNKQK
ncbi:UDP-N-acetylglucosamine diphosphorylase/glucosamine-1-phosphate N-acetyltransferase [bacterium NHP-B]|nr:UDP-N-acetylglucosamine diphosphorylase/glucosamine-1-phosphate N-acetyltransferase [bacterium NHP-B]